MDTCVRDVSEDPHNSARKILGDEGYCYRDRSDNQVEFLGHLSMLSLYAIVDMGYTESAMLRKYCNQF